MSHAGTQFGPLLREWRQRRRISQLDLACQGNISTRHLSFLETGRSRPSREMVLHLAEQLAVPLRDRNYLLAAAGFAPVYRETPLGDPGLQAARRAMEAVIHGHMPYPALAVDRHWILVTANDAVRWLLADVDPSLLAPPVNVLRLALHPSGLAPRTINLPAWRAHLLFRLQKQVEASADPVLAALLAELRGYPAPRGAPVPAPASEIAAAIPFDLATPSGPLSFISMTAVFGTPVDITLSELAMESFYPANEETARVLAARMQAPRPAAPPQRHRPS
ncbi:MAG TPA: helix-turn-helix transcriptional regulator [Rhodopila sp.]|nr:helix-turn-helix transcriptional regulator [Rhodopila sp.]